MLTLYLPSGKPVDDASTTELSSCNASRGDGLGETRFRGDWTLVTLGWTSVKAEEPAASVGLSIDFGDGFQKQYSMLAWREGVTVLDVLEQASRHPRGIKYEFRGKNATAFVTSIDGVINEGKGRNWTFRVNGQLADRSAGVYPLKPNDNVLWKFADKP